MKTGDKTQPQELLEEILPRNEDEKYPSDPEPIVDAPKFPTIEEQQAYWDEKEKAGEPKPPKKRRRRAKEPPSEPLMVIDHPMYDYPPTDEQLAKVHVKRMAPVQVGRPVETLDTHRKKWSLARRRAYNAKVKAKAACAEYDKAKGWLPVPPPPQEEPVAMIRFCPCCGKNIERWLS